jgi:radical SAM superfamily enzyme YgiQ (UPF0313 family)
MAQQDTAEEARRLATGRRRVRVVPVQHDRGVPPLALGMIFAYLPVHDGGRLEEWYEVRPDWTSTAPGVDRLGDEPTVLMVSNYIWSHQQNLAFSERAKREHPDHLVVHGGPNTPKYRGDIEGYLARHPFVDVLVRGEGEVTVAEALAALGPGLSAGAVDLEVLRDVAGVAFRSGDEVVVTPDRDRIADLDVLPSPYLEGLFDDFAEAGTNAATIETNRGCPYGCTFCDWGSATMSRIRKFSLDRVLAELEWCARAGVVAIGFADANFGIFERDATIAAHVVELKRRYGAPLSCRSAHAKNTVKHLRPIIDAWHRAGIMTEGMLSLQTNDAATLDAIDRTNIRPERYHELAAEFRDAGLPLLVCLMMGLPGSTVASFEADLQECIDQEVVAQVFPTELLVNSPMNEPSYRERHQIVARPAASPFRVEPALPDSLAQSALIVSTSTFTRAEYREMEALRQAFRVAENFGLLRQVSRFVRQETGRREVDLYRGLITATRDEPGRFPLLAVALQGPEATMIGLPNWDRLLGEVRDHLVIDLGVADDGALDAVLRVQRAVLPVPSDGEPVHLALDHDVAAWHRSMLDAKRDHADWAPHVPRLRDHPPGTFTVTDPDGIGAALRRVVGMPYLGRWELQSPVARALAAVSQSDVSAPATVEA